MTMYDILSAEFFADPYPTLAALRSTAPCWYDARLGAYIVTRYQDVSRVLRDSQFSSERVSQFGRGAPAQLEDKLAVYVRELERWLLFCDPPLHTALRRRLGRAFGDRLRALTAHHVHAAVADALARLARPADLPGPPDLVRDYAYPVPTAVLAHLLGIPNDDIERFKRWTLDIFALIGAGIADAAAIERGYRGVTELRDYVLALLRERRARPGDDMLTDLAHPEPGDAAVSDDDIVGMFMTMIVAGHETTTNLIANALHGILTDRGARAQLLGRPDGGPSEEDIDELVRFDGPVFSLIRRARVDVEIAGQPIRAGECVFAMLNAGNRDPWQFPDPDRIDFGRPRPAHLGLGGGLHACIGAAMARTVASVAIAELLRAWPDAAIEPGVAWQQNLSIRGPAKLPVRLAATHALPDLAENRPRRIAATLRASSVAEVRDAVQAANQRGAPLYPVSTGKNWGLGSRSPVEDDAIVLDLSGMASIRDLDLERGVAVVEPGVTQGMLADRLQGTPFLLNVTTSCRDSSIVGNALDRGQGMLRLRLQDLLGVEVVLGNGAVVTTGGAGPAARGGFFGRSAGPDATQLFCQSNFGVVTAAAIALVPRPECTNYLYASFRGDSLSAVIDCIARLRRERVIDHIAYCSEMQLAPGARGLPDFTVLAPVLGRRRVALASLSVARDELAAIAGCTALRTGDAAELAPGDPIYHRARAFLGIPSCEPLRARFGTTTCELDETSRVGWSVLQTLLPLDGRAAAAALAALAAGVAAWGVPVQPNLSSVTSRSLHLMSMIWFQRTPDGIARMRELRGELQQKLAALGHYASREGIDLLDGGAAHARDDAWAQLKAALDPQNIIAPGRYVAA